MANIATPSTSANASTTLASEIDFEDFMSSNSILVKTDSSELDKAAGTEENEVTASSSKNITELSSNLVSLTKIAPKPTTTTTTAKMSSVKAGNSGQVVIIQGPGGNPLPIRIAGSNTNTTTSTTTSVTTKSLSTTNTTSTGNMATKTAAGVTTKQSPVTIQVLKMPDGSLVQIKNNKALNLTNLSNISQLNVASKIPGLPVIVKTANGTKTVFGAQTKLAPVSFKGSQILKSLTLSEAQKAGFLKPKTLETSAAGNKFQKILPLPSTTVTTKPISPKTSTVSSSSNIASKEVQIKSEVTTKSESDGTTKQIIVPPHMIKLDSNAGPIQAIQIPGKSGLQYVRVLTPGFAAGQTKLVTAGKKEISPTKPQIVGTHRIVMNANGKPGLSFVSSPSSKDATQINKGNTKQTLISTVPTLRKIQDNTLSKMISVQKDGESSGSNQVVVKKIISNANAHTLHNNVSAHSTGSNNQTASISNSKILVLPQKFLRKIQPVDTKTSNTSISSASEETPPPAKQYSSLKPPSLELPDEFNTSGSRKRSPTPEALRRKHCNCTKSQCLKLYCDCFASGEFCQDCNCKECFNNLEYEDERQKAIKICLERNPNAFKPKITKAKDQSDLRLHNKGCNCKRSGCLKNYCECYEAKIACSSNCKCFGCRNVEDRHDRDSFDDLKTAAPQNVSRSGANTAHKRSHEDVAERPAASSASSSARGQDGPPPNKQPYNFITQDVVDATIQCMIAQADECKKSGMTHKITERMIIEELGRCLVEIIDFSIRNMEN